MTDLTPAQVEELERLEKAATPGPWKVGAEDGTRLSHVWPVRNSAAVADCSVGDWRYSDEEMRDNAAFIAALRNAAPALLAALKRPEEGECEAMAKRLDEWAKLDDSYSDRYSLWIDAAAMLRRLARSTPDAGEWRLGHDASIADLQKEIGRLQGILHRRVLGDPRIGVSAQAAPPKTEGGETP